MWPQALSVPEKGVWIQCTVSLSEEGMAFVPISSHKSGVASGPLSPSKRGVALIPVSLNGLDTASVPVGHCKGGIASKSQGRNAVNVSSLDSSDDISEKKRYTFLLKIFFKIIFSKNFIIFILQGSFLIKDQVGKTHAR